MTLPHTVVHVNQDTQSSISSAPWWTLIVLILMLLLGSARNAAMDSSLQEKIVFDFYFCYCEHYS